jgi:hypothetical protein
MTNLKHCIRISNISKVGVILVETDANLMEPLWLFTKRRMDLMQYYTEIHEADIVVVGGDSAGCVLAARLSENPGLRVLLVEAGR